MALRLMVSEADCTYVLPVNVLGQLWGAFNGKSLLPAVASSTSASLYETRCHIPPVARDGHLPELGNLRNMVMLALSNNRPLLAAISK